MHTKRPFPGMSTAPASKWHEYERRKREWVEKNGWKSEAEYQAAIKKICDDIGI